MIARVTGAAVRGEQVIREMQWAISEIDARPCFIPRGACSAKSGVSR